MAMEIAAHLQHVGSFTYLGEQPSSAKSAKTASDLWNAAYASVVSASF